MILRTKILSKRLKNSENSKILKILIQTVGGCADFQFADRIKLKKRLN